MDVGSGLARNARRHPDKLAVVYGNRRLTYHEVNAEVNRMAHGLLALGVQKGDKVALFMKNSDWFAIAYFAAAKVGAVLVPINFRLTAAETAYILDHSDSSVVVCDPEFADVVAQARSEANRVRYVIETPEGQGASTAEADRKSWQDAMSEDVTEPDVAVDASDDLEILYTSGTTGKPKGVLLDHQRVLNVGIGMMAMMGLSSEDRLLHLAPLFHSAQLNLFMQAGFFLGTTHVIHRDFNPVEVLRDIDAHKITLFFAVPTMYTYLLQVPNRGGYDLSSVTRCGYGAAPMAPELVKKSMGLFGTKAFYNLCGLTEAGPGGIYLNPRDHETKLGASGLPGFNTEARVVNFHDEDTAVGEVGELVLRGETVMKGYYKNPAATEETLRNGWLHTGDLAVRDEDGYMTLVDRKKDMIISGGENVYSVEVEQVINGHPSVLEAAVIGTPHEVWGEQVTAVVVPKRDETITLEDLVAFCRPYLAGYKIPRKLMVSTTLPRNASGKVLKYQLRDGLRTADH